MSDYSPIGRGHGHVTHFYVFWSGHIFGADEARHLKFGLQIDRQEYWHYTYSTQLNRELRTQVSDTSKSKVLQFGGAFRVT